MSHSWPTSVPIATCFSISNSRPNSRYSGGEFIQPFTGVLAYAVSNAAQFRRMAGMADAILKGTKPADIPVEQPTVYDLAVNLKTAKAIGITIPQSILYQATAVVE